MQNWKSHSAKILPKKRFEVGLFQPFRYGYSETLEYSTYPLWFFVMPNMTLKKSHDIFLDIMWQVDGLYFIPVQYLIWYLKKV